MFQSRSAKLVCVDINSDLHIELYEAVMEWQCSKEAGWTRCFHIMKMDRISQGF